MSTTLSTASRKIVARKGGSKPPDPRLRPLPAEHQLGHRTDHRVGAVGRPPRTLVAAADGQPGQLVLKLGKGAGEPRRAALEQGLLVLAEKIPEQTELTVASLR